jgi:hypothetical protein
MKLDFPGWFSRQATGSSTSALTPASPGTGQSLSNPAIQAMKAQAKRLSDMQDALAQLRAMPSARVEAKQAAASKAAMLKQRLDMMKALLIGATPAQAKAMAAQIKAIAGELAALAKTLGGASGTPSDTQESGATAANSATASTASTDNASALASGNGQEAVASVGDATTSVKAEPEKPTGNTDATSSGSQRQGLAAYTAQSALSSGERQNPARHDGSEKDADSALKKALGEALGVLREVIAMLKSKIGSPRKEARDVRDAEEQLKTIEQSMSRAESASASKMAVAIPEVTGGLEIGVVLADSSVLGVADTAGDAGNGINISV